MYYFLSCIYNIYFIHKYVSNRIGIFATCPVHDDTCVEKTTDSGRYFVLKIQNAQGRHAFIGIAFNERNDAFDFNMALAEHKGECEREDRASQVSSMVTDLTRPHRDLSLKQGEKITVKIAMNVSSTDCDSLRKYLENISATL